MPDTHKVAPGDNLSKIAKKYGYASWRDIYFHAGNKAFRKLRPDPNKIHPGDVVHLPGKAKAAAGAAPPAKPVPTKIEMKLPWNFAKRLQLNPVLPLYPVALPAETAVKSSGKAGPSPDPADPAVTKPRPDPLRAPSCLRATLPVPLPPPPLSDKDAPQPLGSLGSALWACREIQEPILDLVWNKAGGAQKGIEIGVGLTALTTLLILNATRDSTLKLFDGIPLPAGSAYPDDWAGARWIRPIKPSIIWREHETGGMERGFFLMYDFSGELPEFK